MGNKSTTTVKITLIPILPNATNIADIAIVVGTVLEKYSVNATVPDTNPSISKKKMF